MKTNGNISPRTSVSCLCGGTDTEGNQVEREALESESRADGEQPVGG